MCNTIFRWKRFRKLGLAFLKKAEAWAKDNKCDGIECTARFGFWKWLGKSGWDKAYTVFERRFDNE